MNRVVTLVLGVLALAAIWAVCALASRGSIERDLASRSRSALADANIDWASVDASGRDLTLTGLAPSAAERARAGRVVSAVWGVRALQDETKLAPPEEVVAAEPEGVSEGEEPVAAPICDRADQIVAEIPAIRFPVGSTVLDAKSYGALDRVVALLDCPGLRIELVGHADSQGPSGMNRELSRWRAEAAREYLLSRGVGSGRLVVRGAGESEPVAPNTTAGGRALNRRLEVRLVEPEAG
ncbi:MAG: OmpA family protein [Gemmatimonadetes bacterium]|uniref:OmpA family protein n=1 Tax=Candidatus Kutchimonas denitrificans TaxID=3056748 RepID=A0AAE4Z565_9BACT|nr:OmpA family protein [Gemmatimonadota bacterium]NIR73989.1 OmpA family protein [Candidatus Kutchimonas denitrificans]NIS02978.1 OmpA family protein [Gemmatimonadota bacterium]NIT68695.1 OmpA family protein [Gemmatimonadota bacterium]NIU53276.1 OmpA family protein [Gemmatimonadota bacterium]